MLEMYRYKFVDGENGPRFVLVFYVSLEFILSIRILSLCRLVGPLSLYHLA